jgi:hypothetical protein
MLAIVLALASAIGYGSSDFAAGLASRRAAIIQVNLLASMAYLVVAAAALPFAPSHPPSAAALAWGAGHDRNRPGPARHRRGVREHGQRGPGRPPVAKGQGNRTRPGR